MKGIKKPLVLVIGAASIDLKGKPLKSIKPGTSNPGEVRVTVGGVARNVAENLSRLGLSTILLTAVGDDVSGHLIIKRSRISGINISQIIVDKDLPSAYYLAIIGTDGRLYASIDDMRVIEKVDRKYLLSRRNLFSQADMLFVDTNLNESALDTVFRLSKRYSIPVAADPVSITLAPKLQPKINQCTMITPNAAEAEILSGISINSTTDAITAARRLVALGVKIAVITLASEGLVYATTSDSGHIPAVKVDIVDQTGGSDALTAAIVYGLVNDFQVDEAVRLGVSAAAMTISCAETVCPDLSLENLYATLLI